MERATNRNYKLEQVVSLLKRAPMSASYKPALLRAIVACVHAGKVRDDSILLVDIASEFLRLYWNQTVIFRFRHSPRSSAQPEILKLISQTAEASGIKDLANLSAPARDHLTTRLARVLTINVLAAFHSSKPESMPLLYSWQKGQNFIVVVADATSFLRDNAATLTVISNYYWARFLTRVNTSPHMLDKIEAEIVRRGPLLNFAKAFRAIGESQCFYCGAAFDDRNHMVVDHFIPWSFVYEDNWWNLVPACVPCNTEKSDRLPDESLLGRLLETNDLRRSKSQTLLSFLRSGLPNGSSLTDLYNKAVDEDWPGQWVPKPLHLPQPSS